MADQVADRPAPTPSQTAQEALDEIAEALHEIETLLAGAGRHDPPLRVPTANEIFLSGRWRRLDGTVYAPVASATK